MAVFWSWKGAVHDVVDEATRLRKRVERHGENKQNDDLVENRNGIN